MRIMVMNFTVLVKLYFINHGMLQNQRYKPLSHLVKTDQLFDFSFKWPWSYAVEFQGD